MCVNSSIHTHTILCIRAILYRLYSKHYTTRYALQAIQYTLHFTICAMHFALYAHYALYTSHYALYTMHYTLYIIHFTLYTVHHTLHTIHCTPCTIGLASYARLCHITARYISLLPGVGAPSCLFYGNDMKGSAVRMYYTQRTDINIR